MSKLEELQQMIESTNFIDLFIGALIEEPQKAIQSVFGALTLIAVRPLLEDAELSNLFIQHIHGSVDNGVIFAAQRRGQR